MKQRKNHVAAVIEIGSSAVRMRIAQWEKDAVFTLDSLEKPITLAGEVFTTGRISFAAVRELSAILDGYQEVAQSYGVDRLRVVASTAVREAANRAYLLDHFLIRNRLSVEVLEEGEGDTYLFDEMMRLTRDAPPRLLLVNIGTGAIGFAASLSGSVTLSRELHTGTMKIVDMIRETLSYTVHVDRAVEEYLAANVGLLGKLYGWPKAELLSVAAHEVEALLHLCGALRKQGVWTVDAMRLLAVWEQAKGLTFNQVAVRYDMTPVAAERLYATLAVLASFVSHSGVARIEFPPVDLLDSLLALQLRPRARREFDDALRQSAVASALAAAERFHSSMAHVTHVASIAQTLFAQLRKLHGLSGRQGLLLWLACLLHEVGEYANTRNRYLTAHALVRDMNLYGVNEREAALIAHIAGMPGALLEDTSASNRYWPGTDELLFAVKMHALFRLADALDSARTQKIQVGGVSVDQLVLRIQVNAREDAALERWAFQGVAAQFEDAFGLSPQLLLSRETL